jgi:hypothetical protein
MVTVVGRIFYFIIPITSFRLFSLLRFFISDLLAKPPQSGFHIAQAMSTATSFLGKRLMHKSITVRSYGG